MSVDAVVIGGGPAGSASARLLASWGHSVRLVTRPGADARGLAESLPPSTHKLLAHIGVLDAVERAGFYRSTGNTVFWASREPRVESFAEPGYQVFRPDLDRLLLDCATSAGVELSAANGQRSTVSDARVVIDCSGRAGVIGRRFRIPQPEHRTLAIVGVWRRERWDVPDETHTIVETTDRGWAWSIPTCASIRHVAVMIDEIAAGGAKALEAVYRTQLDEAAALRRIVDGASLERVFACDASLYRSERYAGDGFFLAGDAGSFIDPLSSFGVKKALASAWIAAVAAHTWLIDPDRRAAAVEFVNGWEHRAYDDHLRRSRDFARSAVGAHRSPYWTARANVEVAAADDAVDVSGAFERIRAAGEISFTLDAGVRFEPQPVIRGNEIVVQDGLKACASDTALRYAHDVDLVALAEVACRHRRVPDVYEAYCRAHSAAPLPNVVAGLSLLVARGILHATSGQ